MSTLRVERREGGKPAQLRKQGLLPMAFVERSHQTMTIQAREADVRQAVLHSDGHGRIDVQIGDDETKRKAVVKHIEQNALRKQILHVTLLEVGEEDLLKVETPVVHIGTPIGLEEAEDAVLSNPTNHVRLRGKVAHLPERLEVDVSGLALNGHINAGDITLPEGVTLDSSPDATLFALAVVRDEPLETPTGDDAGTDAADGATPETEE